MVNLNKHIFRCGPEQEANLADERTQDTQALRKRIEPWLTAVFQSEHLSLLLGSGFTSGIAAVAGGTALGMSKCSWQCTDDLWEKVDAHAMDSAKSCGRGAANIEDQLRSAMQMEAGLRIMRDKRAAIWKKEINHQLKCFMSSVLESERSIQKAAQDAKDIANDALVSFLLSFASRTATRERLNLFTTNYDRLVEYGCDLAGLHVLDRFVGTITPVFRTSRLNVDIHYNPPGIRGEPRYLEGVIRFCKIHGSIDWRWEEGELRRYAVPFGASADHPDIHKNPSGTVMIYPNPAKDIEMLEYPYSELLRDFAAAVCRPNCSLVTYGYGFGDDHVNRVIRDMLTIPSTHLVIIAWDNTNPADETAEANGSRKRIIKFCKDVGKQAQISLLLGSHFGDIQTLVENYLPKPAIDPITIRKTQLKAQRDEVLNGPVEGGDNEQAN